MNKIFRQWLVFATIITLLSGLIYLAVQQDLRLSANDPQIQMAEDAANRLSLGMTPVIEASLPQSVDIEKSLSPYLVIYDESEKVLISSGILDGENPSIPNGIFDYARKNGENRLTWQPKPRVRQAIVVVHFSGKKSGFVLAGRSLREVEKREDLLLLQVIAGGITTLGVTLMALFLKNIWY